MNRTLESLPGVPPLGKLALLLFPERIEEGEMIKRLNADKKAT